MSASGATTVYSLSPSQAVSIFCPARLDLVGRTIFSDEKISERLDFDVTLSLFLLDSSGHFLIYISVFLMTANMRDLWSLSDSLSLGESYKDNGKGAKKAKRNPSIGETLLSKHFTDLGLEEEEGLEIGFYWDVGALSFILMPSNRQAYGSLHVLCLCLSS